MTDPRRLFPGIATANAILAFLLAVLPPVAYFIITYQYLVGSLDAQAELSARTVSQLVMSNPRTWQFEEVRLTELLERRPLSPDPQDRFLLDKQGLVVAQHADPLDRPVVARKRPVHDAGFTVGQIVVTQSLLPQLRRTALWGLGSVLLSLLAFVFFGVYPRRLSQAAEIARMKSEHRYQTLYHAMKEGLTLFRFGAAAGGAPPSLELLDSNPAFESLLAGSSTDLAGMGVGDFIRATLHKHQARIVEATASAQPLKFEAATPGGDRTFSFSVFSPEPGLFAALVEDLTELRRAQETHAALERKLQHSQKLESLGVLAGGIAHDFNNLLVGIQGNIELAALKAGSTSPAGPYLQRAETAVQRAADLTNQMLAYSGRGRFVVEPVDLSRLVEEMSTLLSAGLSKKARLQLDLTAGLPRVEADATQLRQVVMNLITNASDAIGDKGGVITISTGQAEAEASSLAETILEVSTPAATYVYLEVADTGCGMDAETSRRIFDPFFTTKEKGRGLGLAATMGIIRGHRGTLSVRSDPGAGTSFRVLFPATLPASGTPPALQEPGPTRVRATPDTTTILVVDDEEEVRKVARDMLEGQGFIVLTASDGEEGVELLRSHRAEIAAVLLDMTMPRMGGLETSRQMRAVAPDLPVILCSGYSDQEVPAHSSTGRFIQKPYRIQTLVSILKDAIQQERSEFPADPSR